ncbi:MAG: molybdenum cofactor guanylyltransferase [Candidatus Marinimicrobia bacterium]|nr:molybdenum cofactor guanylyltransferase [Candidatus Neomarinimicrobiota bacterium]MBL7023740.1 molybdenum cofactor guanylyltransferase [Candidatus Neomarinimicrobiota bacterium]MBL7109590.1 molybdenum cofactor guanylyltransferase [Candidatus Neomarinimicrobiota bacterium]
MNAYILTGGQSRRFGSDKSIATIEDLTFTKILYNRLETLFDNVTIIGKIRTHSKLPFLPDKIETQCPMTGIYTGLSSTKSDWNLFVAVDMPMVGKETVNLLTQTISDKVKIIIPTVKDRLQPMCALYHKSLTEDLEKNLQNGNYKLMDFISNHPSRTVNADALSSQFLNVNSPEDFEKLNNY